MFMNKSFKRVVSCLLCVALIGTTSNFSVEKVKAADFVKMEEAKRNSVGNNALSNQGSKNLPETVIFAATYIEDLNCIKALWELGDIVSSDFYVRHDDSLEFKLLKSTKEKEIDIPVDMFNEYCELRVVVTTSEGKSITSDIITMQKVNSTYSIEKRDSDSDGLLDGYEIWDVGTNPFLADTDSDGFTDGYEAITLCTSPLLPTRNIDSDGDGLLDLEEMQRGTNPYLSDGDFDGKSDLQDLDPFITDYKEKRAISYDVKMVTGEFDETYEFRNADNELCKLIVNTLTKAVKYYKVGELSESSYYYDINNNLIAQVNKLDGQFAADTYAYEGENITFIGHEGVSYKFDYDSEGNIIETQVGDQVIAEHDYIDSLPIKTVFANHQKIEYGYDTIKENITSVKVNGDIYYENNYDKNGNMLSQKDIKNDVFYRYQYDKDNLLKSIKADNGFDIEYSTDEDGQVISYNYNGIKKKQSQKLVNNNTITTLINGAQITLPLNKQDHKQNVILKNEDNKLIYNNEIIKESDNKVRINSNNGLNQIYTFDTNGNAIGISEDGKEVSSYEYDNLNRIVRSNNIKSNETVLYEYDKNNNIIAEKHCAYTKASPATQQSTNDYQYSDPNWKDLLTSYNGESITYDEIGNPLHYLDGMDFTWDHGRKLSNIKMHDSNISYSYNSEGLRTKKTINGIAINYLLDGTKIIAEETNGKMIWYSYDSDDNVIGFEYENQKYYYEKNIQNDIVGIYDNNGNIVVNYTYDDWGNLANISGDQVLGKLNKLRYRSYYFDEESGFYYLQSRYYDSKTGRFLNADEKMATFNAFTYCSNNPINYVDYEGKDAAVVYYYCIALMFVGFLALYYFYTATEFMSKWRAHFHDSIARLTYELDRMGSAITGAILQEVWSAADNVSIYVADKIKQYTVAPTFNSQYEVHHIVAQTHSSARHTREILNMNGVKISVHDSRNLVPLKTAVHKHLHTQAYFYMVDAYITHAYYAGTSNVAAANVSKALLELKVFLLAISEGAPF